MENVALQEKLDNLTENRDRESVTNADDIDGGSSGRFGVANAATSKVFSSSGRLKSHTNKLKYQTNKIMSGLKVKLKK